MRKFCFFSFSYSHYITFTVACQQNFASFSTGPVRLTTGLWTFPPSVCRPYQRQSKSKAKCTHMRSALPFSFVFDFARSPTDVKPPDALPCGRCPRGCASRYALRYGSTTAGHHHAGLAYLARCHARLHGSARL